MTVEIIIQPLSAQLDYTTLDNLRNEISREFENIKVKVPTSNNSKLVELKKIPFFNLHLISTEINGIPPSYWIGSLRNSGQTRIQKYFSSWTWTRIQMG